VQTAIAQYKQLRPLIRQGRFHHLLPQPAYECPDLIPYGQWEAYALVDAGAQHGALWAFRAADGEPARSIPLAGLAADRVYRLTDQDTQQVATAAGAQWMQAGIAIDLSGRTSALLLIEAADG